MKYTAQFILAGFLLLLGTSQIAHAQNCSTYPYTFVNGQSADANQVNSNFASIRTCANTNLLGAANNLSDVQSASGSRTNLGLGASAVEGLGNNVVDDGAGNLLATNALRAQSFTTSGTFTVPAGVASSVVFKISAVGGGGGSGGASGSNVGGGGGAAGGFGIGWFSGLTAGQTMAVTIGAGGTGGASNGTGFGNTGGTSTVASPNSTAILSCLGGGGGAGATSSGAAAGASGSTGACTITASGSGLTLTTSLNPGYQSGGFGLSPYFSGTGGMSPLGPGGSGKLINGGSVIGNAGSIGGGAGGSISNGTGEAGASGGGGGVLIEWVQ